MEHNTLKKILSDVNEYAKCYFGGEWDEADTSILTNDYIRCILPDRQAFFEMLNNYFFDDKELLIMVLSALFQGTHDVWCLDRLDEINISSDLHFNMMHALWINSYANRFKYGLPNIPYNCERKMLSLMINNFSKTIEYDNFRKPFLKAEPAKKNIVIITEQLLTIDHAPTKVIMDFCAVYNKILKYNVLLLVLAEGKGSEDEALNNLFNPYIFNYNDNLWGSELQTVRFTDGTVVNMIQTIISVNRPDIVGQIVKSVYEFQPSYIINIGSAHMIAELLGLDFYLASLSLNAGLPVSNAPILLRLAKNDDVSQEKFATENRQVIIDFDYRILSINSEISLSRAMIGALESDFLIAIMGNRLDTEINEEFIEVMRKIIQKDAQIRFLIIGDHSIDFAKSGLDKCVISLGYRKDYIAVLKLTNLFMNPRRAGGGTGGQNAVLAGVPVITLPGCDVANVLNESAFICDSYDSFPEYVERYIKDSDYHDELIEACHRVQERYRLLDGESEIVKVDATIRTLIRDTEMYESSNR